MDEIRLVEELFLQVKIFGFWMFAFPCEDQLKPHSKKDSNGKIDFDMSLLNSFKPMRDFSEYQDLASKNIIA